MRRIRTTKYGKAKRVLGRLAVAGYLMTTSKPGNGICTRIFRSLDGRGTHVLPGSRELADVPLCGYDASCMSTETTYFSTYLRLLIHVNCVGSAKQ